MVKKIAKANLSKVLETKHKLEPKSVKVVKKGKEGIKISINATKPKTRSTHYLRNCKDTPKGEFGHFAKQALMVSPTNFRTNYETAADNKFGKAFKGDTEKQALHEFSGMVENYKEVGVKINVFKQCHPDAMDSLFPNNWFSTHRNENCPHGVMIIYPMKARDRRLERNPAIINFYRPNYKYLIDLTYLENENEFLESTGVLIFDHKHRKIYCNVSSRATPRALEEFERVFNSHMKKPYRFVKFRAFDHDGFPIYHTNVLMACLEKHILICLDTIHDPEERKMVEKECIEGGRGIINISFDELYHMGGNVIGLQSKDGKPVVSLSKNAYLHYKTKNRNLLEENYYLCVNDIDTVEIVGGGSCRCMTGEIF